LLQSLALGTVIVGNDFDAFCKFFRLGPLLFDQIGHPVDEVRYVLQLQIKIENSAEVGYISAAAAARRMLGRKNDLSPLGRPELS
jgi:hypothetical protein